MGVELEDFAGELPILTGVFSETVDVEIQVQVAVLVSLSSRDRSTRCRCHKSHRLVCIEIGQADSYESR